MNSHEFTSASCHISSILIISCHIYKGMCSFIVVNIAQCAHKALFNLHLKA